MAESEGVAEIECMGNRVEWSRVRPQEVSVCPKGGMIHVQGCPGEAIDGICEIGICMIGESVLVGRYTGHERTEREPIVSHEGEG